MCVDMVISVSPSRSEELEFTDSCYHDMMLYGSEVLHEDA